MLGVQAICNTTVATPLPPAPLTFLPSEMFQEVFGQYVRDASHIAGTNTALCLGHVCSSWRQIAHNCPSLWTAIVIDRDLEGSMACDPQLVSLWLNNSGSLALDIYFTASPIGLYDRSKDYTNSIAILSLLLGVLPRWRTACIWMPDFALTTMKPTPFRFTDALQLTYLQIDIPLHQGVTFTALANFHGDFPSIWRNAPRLTSVIIADHSDYYGGTISWPLLLGIRFSQLTSVELDGHVSAAMCVEVLQRAPHLIEARFLYVDDAELPRPDQSLIVLNSLEELTVRSPIGLWKLSDILNHITTPSLFKLNVHGFPSSAGVLDFVIRSGCSLGELDLEDMEFSWKDLEHLICITIRTVPYSIAISPAQHANQLAAVFPDLGWQFFIFSDFAVPSYLCTTAAMTSSGLRDLIITSK